MLRLRRLTFSMLAALLALGCSDPPPPATPAAVLPSSAPPLELAARMEEANARERLAGGRLEAAARAALEAGRLYQQLRGPVHPDTGRVAELYASIKLRLGDYEGAEQALLLTLAATEAEAGPSTLRVAAVLDLLVKTTEVHAPESAIASLSRALTIRKATLGPEHPEVARTLTEVGSLRLKVCRPADAEAALREALAIRERAAGPSSASVAELLEKLSEARWQGFDDRGAEQLLVRGAALGDPSQATEAEPLVRLLRKLAKKEREWSDFAPAAAHAERAVSLAARYLGATSEALTMAADELATTYRAQGNAAAVSTLFQRLSLVERVLPPGAALPISPPSPNPASPPSRCTSPGSEAHDNGSAGKASAVIVGLAPSFRACYNSALRQDPAMKGWFRMTATIGAGGEVLRVRTLAPASFAEIMIQCPMERLLAARFAPPEGGGATIVVPLTFVSR